MKNVFIVDALRTPIGTFMGGLSPLSGPMMAQEVIKALLKKTSTPKESVEEVILGQVLQGGQGQAPARQAAILAGLDAKTPCMTINKVCGSGLKAIMLAADSICLERAHTAIAGGMESMSNAPYAVFKARSGLRMGDGKMSDLMLHDGLMDPFEHLHMGLYGELCADKHGFTRKEQDDYAINSYEKALAAQKSGFFTREIVPVTIQSKKQEIIIKEDEELLRFAPEKFSKLPTVFKKDGTITPANASKINDGASAALLMSKKAVEESGLSPRAKIVAMATFAQEPKWFTTAPIMAIKAVLQKANLTIGDIDHFEINEAFSVVSMAAIKELGLDGKRVNTFGGAVALGHPIGCSGARLLTTLLNTLEEKSAQYGLVTLCLGGGEAVAMVVKNLKL